MKKSLIYLDKKNLKNSIDLLEVVRQIYVGEQYETYGISGNHHCVEGEGIFDQLIHVTTNDLSDSNPMIVTDIIERLHQHYKFDSIIIPATQFGRMLAPRLAMRLKVGLVADVTAINRNNDVLEMIRPAFSGKIMAAIVKRGEGPIMMSVRQNVFTYKEQDLKETRKIDFYLKKGQNNNLKLLKTEDKNKSYDIRDSEVLISGGGGTIKYFEKLELLAQELSGQVSASRKIIDKGIAPRAIQVGQSGKTVSPKLYVALGINGAIQHIEGLKNVDHIISVNTNKSAPICSLSDLVVEGDAYEFIDKLVKKIQSNKYD